MAGLVVKGGTVECSHGGVAPLITGSPLLTVDGLEVVVSGMEVGINFAATVIPCPYTSGSNPSPCTSTIAATNGVSTKIRVSGQCVLLDTASGNAINANDPAAKWDVADAGQNILIEG